MDKNSTYNNCVWLRLLMRKYRDRVHINGMTLWKCMECLKYHRAIEVTKNCFELNHVYILPDYIKRDMSMQKPTNVTNGKVSTAVKDEDFVKKYPTLFAYLTDAVWSDGTDREVSTLSLFIEDGAFKIALNDRDLQRSAYITGESLRKALEAMERAVATETADWRPWHGKKAKKGR